MKKYRTIRLSEETYQDLLKFRAELELENRSRVSFDEAIELLFTEIHGLEYEMANQKIAARQTD